MTDATVEQQGESKRRRKHPDVPQAADSSSSSSSSSESSTDTEMGLVDVCTILRDNSEAEGRCEGGPITLDLTKWDINKADCRNKCRKLVENSKPLLLRLDHRSTLVERTKSGHGGFCTWHSSSSGTKHNCTGVGVSFTHTHILQTVGNSQQLWLKPFSCSNGSLLAPEPSCLFACVRILFQHDVQCHARVLPRSKCPMVGHS